MSISRIKNTWLRRAVIVPNYIVLLPLSFLAGAIHGGLEWAGDLHSAAVRAWFGK